MVEIEDIQDADTLRAWLDQVLRERGKDEGHRIAILVAHRAAVRVLPRFWRWSLIAEAPRKQDLTSLPVLRASLVSGVVCEMSNVELRENARAAAHGVSANRVLSGIRATRHSNPTNHLADLAARAAARTADAAALTIASAQIAVIYVADAASDAADNTADAWAEIRLDAEAALGPNTISTPLWAGENSLSDIWVEVKSATQSAPEGPTHWSFWRRWYEDLLKGGRPRNPALLKAIALIHPEDWEKGPAFINDVKIPELQAEHARHIASTAAEIRRDGETGTFTEVAVSDLEDGLFRDARERADEAITDFRTYTDRPQSPYRAFEDDLNVIETQLARTADRPIRCYENLADAMLKILDMARYNGLEKDSRVTTLVREFERSRRDLRADDDKIAARETKRIRIGYDELMDAEQDEFRAMLSGFADKSDDTLKAEMTDDEAAIAQPETLKEIRDRALLRSSERMVQMNGIERDEAAKAKPSLEDVGKKADAVNKVAKATGTGFNVIGKIVEWLLT